MAPDRPVTPQLPRAMRKLREPRTVQRISLGCLNTKHPLRRVCIKILQSPWFDRVIILAVCCNTVILGLVDYENAWVEGPNPNMGVNKLIEQWNGVSLYIFVAEMVVKIIAMGFFVGEGAYLLDSWNRLDFVIVLSGMLSVLNIKVGFVRVLRVLRPLRTLHTFPGLKVLTNSLLSSLPALGNVAILLAFIYIVFAILGMEIWRGAFHSRCRLTPFPIALPFDALNPPGANAYPVSAAYLAKVLANPAWYRCNKSDGSAYLVDDTWDIRANCFWPLDSGLPMPRLCSSSGRTCNVNQTCGSNYDPNGNPRFLDIAGPLLNLSIMGEPTFNANLNFGLTNFDNLGNTLMVILQVVTASGWMALTETAQWVGNPALAAIYFNLLLIIGMCFLLQLNMAVLFTEFEKAKDQQAKAAHARAVDVIKRLSMVPPPPVSTSQTKRIDTADVVVAPAWRRCVVEWRLCIRQVVLTTAFRRLGIFITLSNVFVMSLNHTEMSYTFAYNCEVLNFTFMIYFGIESLLKMIALDLRPFWADKFNRFDLFTFLIGIVEAMLNPPTFIDGTSGGSGLFTAFRVARAFKLARSWKSLNKLLMAILNSFGEILNFLFFLVLFCYIYALLGIELFATKFQFDVNNHALPYNNTNPTSLRHRNNFDSITWAFFTVFQVITYDNFPNVTYDGWISVGWISPVYFASIIVFGVWIVMNMFSAILVQSCMVDDEDDDDDKGDDGNNGKRRTRRPANRRVRRAKRAMFQLIRFFDANVHDPNEARQREAASYLLNKGNALLLFSPRNPIRRFCVVLLQRREWTWFISISIAVSCIFTAIDTPLLDPNSSLGQSIATSNAVFAMLFTCELVIAVIAKGLFFGRGAYLKDPWRILDGFIVSVSVLPYLIGNAKGTLSGLRALRAFRAFRPLRVINKLPQLKIVVNTLFRCIPDILNALVFFFFMLFIFGLMGISLFKGALSTCSISPYTYTQGTGTPAFPPWFPSGYAGDFVTNMTSIDTMTYPIAWSNMTASQKAPYAAVWNTTGCGPFADDYLPTSKQMCLCFAATHKTTWNSLVPQKFDNIFWAVAGLYELTTMEAWSLTALAAVDSVGEDMQPILNNQPLVMIWWWLYMIVCAFFITNLFIGVLCDSFCRESYGAVVTEEQIKWIKLQKKVLALSPQVTHPVPHGRFRELSFHIVHWPWFEYIITACILVNMICMAIQAYGQSASFLLALSVLNSIFTGIFTCEAILKLNAFGYAYFDEAWNRFDFTIVVFAMASIILPLVTTSLSLGTVLTVVRVFRVGRALRLIKKAKLMKNLFDTLTVSLPAVGNVTSLLMLLFYIYSAVGVQLFAKVAYNNQGIHQYQNFQNFFRALQALIGFSTGENWDNFTWEIYYTSPATNPSCDDRTFNGNMCGFNDTDPYNCIPLDGCGSWFIVPFMYSMYLIIGYLGMNLFSGIVIDAIGDSSAASPVNPATLAEFADRWAEFDPQGGGLITAEELADFLYTVYPPFGFKSVPGFTRRRVVIAIGELDIPVYDKIYVHFKDVPRALVMRVLAEGSVTKYNEINKLMDQLGINKQFDELWHRRRGKKQKDRLSMREVGRVKEYSATIMIQRFVQRARAKRLRAKLAATDLSTSDPDLAHESATVHGEPLMSVDAPETTEASTAIA
ncbi:hypothetical protein SPRG_10680 [Saprolegnia parasitica CBS 223.65]|uniref:EF-hand domain-containing protein n=1 Tax=Saprolegnia parasitica (strain CBS 223.65) TaxID=695850 RepID=A0A067C0B6_SAPPC|nr:hypothetical protein SPRG_10680 [Saprolegnia parasitica CBS 223.65]KDO23983.1 hypothetical protein SPRG_10680 [Saprolegnia parasitica CBS 223.65]|eukprot:XP_012205304.1 hypothetical protein SPRG_10680 [Saprolegnia parasitica CBS 223.65]